MKAGDKMDLTSVGAKIKKSRQAMNITQEQLAEKLEISTGFLSRVENGVSIAGFETYCEICEVLNITLDYLTNDILLPTKKKHCELAFHNAIENMNSTQIDYILNVINNFNNYLDKEN